MKKVFNNSELSHVWVHKSQETGRTPNGAFFFDGDTIYSWGRHFHIARHVTNAEGRAAVLLTTRRYSVSTAQHISLTARAIPAGLDTFEVDEVRDDTNAVAHNLADYAKRIAREVTHCVRGRSVWKKEYAHKNALDLRAEALQYAQFYAQDLAEVNRNLPVVPPLDSEMMEKLAEKEAVQRQKREAEEKRQRELNAVRDAERIEEWRKGKYVGNLYNVPTMLRINGEEVETSLGARVPVEHARRALAWVRNVVARGVEFVPNGKTFHVGHYAVDRIEVDGTLHAGCHVISYREIERIAPLLETETV